MMKNKGRMMNNYRTVLFFTVVFSGLLTNAVSLQDIEPEIHVLPTITSISSSSPASTTTLTSTGTPPSTLPSTSTTPATTLETTTETTPSTSMSSTTEPSTTTSKPSPPSPTPGIWMVTDGNTTCILAKLTASLVVPYVTNDGKFLNSSVFSLPGNATANGTCKRDGNTQEIALSWTTDQSMKSNSLVIVFANNSEENFFVSEVTLSVYTDPKYFPNATSNYLTGQVNNATFYQTKVNTSYQCSSESLIHIPINDSLNNTTALITVKHFQLEAFRTKHGEEFSRAMECPADGMLTSDVVPIAVGCALAALVVVVLIAYLIGRRRARQRGYQSV